MAILAFPGLKMQSKVSEHKYQCVLLMSSLAKRGNMDGNVSFSGLDSPDFLKACFNDLLAFPPHLRRCDSDIKEAVDAWCTDRNGAEEKYGHIEEWDTASVTNMDRLFYNKKSFNDDISHWCVSNVTSMEWMFFGAAVFDQDLSNWDFSSCENMDDELMFEGVLSRQFDISPKDFTYKKLFKYTFKDLFSSHCQMQQMGQVVPMQY
jgi:hypothetical protein